MSAKKVVKNKSDDKGVIEKNTMRPSVKHVVGERDYGVSRFNYTLNVEGSVKKASLEKSQEDIRIGGKE